MHWANPAAFYFILIVPALVGLYVIHVLWKQRRIEALGEQVLVRRLIGRHSNRKDVLRFSLTMLGLLLCIVALARPQWGEQPRTLKREGIDIAVALDISKSMLAQDANPNRLRAAKDELVRVLGQLGGDRVGLVVYAGISFPQSPLTGDYGAINFYLSKLDPSMIPVGGTTSGRALLDSVELLTGERLARSQQETGLASSKRHKRAKTQIIVLITDGEDHQGNPVEAAKKAQERGIRVYTVGFGSAQGEPIPLHDASGNLTGYKKDRQGNTVTSKLNEESLRQIAAAGGGQYFHYEGKGTIANAITKTLNTLEREELATLLRVEREERFHFALIPGLLFLLLATLLSEQRGVVFGLWRRRRKRKKTDAARVLLPWLLLGSALPLALGNQGCDTMHETLVVQKVGEVEEGNTLLKQGKASEALKRYLAAEKRIPTTPSLHYDLGLSYTESGTHDQAVSRLSRAVEAQDEDLRFKALFNLGISYFRQEKWEEAMEAFKGALRLKPEDQDAKFAYEVALGKVYPPCHALEDELEDNDTIENASVLQQPKLEEQVLCGGDDDWFVTQVYPGSIIRARATFKRLRKRESGDPPMLPSPEQLRLAIFGPDGKALGVSDAEPEKDEAAEPEKDAKDDKEEEAIREIGPMRLTAEMLKVPPPMGEQTMRPAVVKVAADEPLEFSYNVEVMVIPPCFALEDKYEENDTLEAAATLEPGPEHALHICKDDEEWFTLEIAPQEAVFVDIVASVDAETETIPDLDVVLFDETGQTPVSATEVVMTPGGPLKGVGVRESNEARTVKLRIRGVDGKQQGPYMLRIYRYPPCPEGDDRFEENNSPASAKDLNRSEGPIRHLRHCPGNQDFYRLDSKKGDSIVLGIKHDELEPEADAEADTEDNGVAFKLLNEAGDTLVTDSAPVQVAPPAQAPVQRALATEELEEDTVYVLEVSSKAEQPRFYHIVPMEGDKAQPQPQEQQEQDQEQDQDENQDENQEENQEQSDSGDKEEEKEQPEDSEGKEGEEEEKQDEEKSAEEEAQEAEEREAELRNMEEILESLEDGDNNFQLRKALEDMPNRYIENDW